MQVIYLLLVVSNTLFAQEVTQSSKFANNNIPVTTSLSSAITATTTLSIEETIDVNTTTETALTTICEENNSSCFISTIEPSSNDSSTETNVTEVAIKKTDHHINTATSNKEFCTCNLQLNVCDINCCCDQDCSSQDKLVFHHCESELFFYDTRYCEYMKYIYINNTPFQWHVNQNGLFCVLKTNLPTSYTVQRKKPLGSFESAEQEKIDKFSWTKTTKKKEINFSMSKEFIFGSNIWIVHENKIKKLKVPKKYFSNTCIIEEEVLNLKAIKNRCAQIDISDGNRHLNFGNYFENVTIVANPLVLNISKFKNLQDCPRNVCLSISPKICELNFRNCQNISRNDSRLIVKCNFDIRNNRNNCKNVVKALRYNFYHNGIEGYTKVELLATLEEVSFEFGLQDFEFFQEFNINFWWTNQTTNFSSMLSGNPGYLVGKPILNGYLINLGNATNTKLKIQRNAKVYLENFLTLPENTDGNCILNSTNYIPIEFGYNVLTKCKFSTTVFNRKKYLNGTEMCRIIQKTILNLWGISFRNKTVGMFGNASANFPEEWIQVMYNLHFDKLLNQTVGEFGSGNTTLSCFGLVNNVVVDIFHSRVDFATLLNQEKILGVTYSFGGFLNKTLSYNRQSNSTSLQLDLESRVVFYDITVEKRKKFVDSPSLEIKLPYDFFFPFIKIENGVELLSANYVFYIIGCLVILGVK